MYLDRNLPFAMPLIFFHSELNFAFPAFHFISHFLALAHPKFTPTTDTMSFCSAHGWPCSNKSDPKQPGVPASPDIDASRILKSIPTRCGADCLESSTEYLSEGCTTTSTSIPCRHPYFWDHWGNVIVQVGCVVYRLHGPNLARHSQVFADILCNQPKYIANGVPFHCAILAGVNTTDFEILLDALENPLYV